MSTLTKMQYPFEKMKLQCLYKNESVDLCEEGVNNASLLSVYGEALMFPSLPVDKPYLYSSLVTSIDGRIAFNDAPEGPFIASKNYLAKEGSIVDWYTLNVLRASADGIIFGANTLKAEPKGTGHVYEQSLEETRIQNNKHDVPWNIIPTLDGKDVPYDHFIFACNEVPIMFYTTTKGMEYCIRNIKKQYVVVKKEEDIVLPLDVNTIYLIVSGEEVMDHAIAMRLLKKMQIEKLLVESPTLMHIFIQEKLMDELFLNYSCVYLGGNALTIGAKFPSFDSVEHPHTQLLRIYMHSDHFLYFRHRLLYDVKAQ